MAQPNNCNLNMSDDSVANAPSTPIGGNLVNFDELAMIGPMPVANDDHLADLQYGDLGDLGDIVNNLYESFYDAHANDIAKNLNPPAPAVHAVTPPAAAMIAAAPVDTNNNFNFNNININNNIAQPAPVVHPVTPTAAVNALAVYNNDILKLEPIEVGVLALPQPQPQPKRKRAAAMQLYPKHTTVFKLFELEDYSTDEVQVYKVFSGEVRGYSEKYGWWRVKWNDNMSSDETEEEMEKMIEEGPLLASALIMAT